MPVESRFVHLGKPAPTFNLPSVNGQEISLLQYLGKKNVVLVFLRSFH
jgi:peroxiredoxin